MSVHENVQGHDAAAKAVTIKVNNQAVTMPDHKATGAAIKADFALFWKTGGAPLKPIGDQDTVELHEGQTFTATPPDDTSRS
jgi:hypothetical protein